MNGQNGKNRIKKYLNEEQHNETDLRIQLLSELDPRGSLKSHPTSWLYYQFLTIEEAGFLSGMRNIGFMIASKAKSKKKNLVREIDGHLWFYCSVSFLCAKFNISARVENRLIKKLVADGFLHKKVITKRRKRYIRIDMVKIEQSIRGIRRRPS